MVLYLAGLKAVDPSLREAAQIDGANERQTFLRVVFPVLRPINIVILVITVIESLRAFDLAYIINKGLNGLELLSMLVTDNIIGEASRVGFGSAIAVVLLLISVGPIVLYLGRAMREEQPVTTATATREGAVRVTCDWRRDGAPHLPDRDEHPLAVPAAWAVYTSFRPYCGHRRRGYVSLPGTVNLDNYVDAWNGAELPRYFLNTLIIVVPAVILVLFLASMMAFAVSRYSWRFNLAAADAVHGAEPAAAAGHHHAAVPDVPEPASAEEPVRDPGFPATTASSTTSTSASWPSTSHSSSGFCTFVLSNYMKTLPHELNEAAIVDGASVWTTYRKIIMPLTHPRWRPSRRSRSRSSTTTSSGR